MISYILYNSKVKIVKYNIEENLNPKKQLLLGKKILSIIKF